MSNQKLSSINYLVQNATFILFISYAFFISPRLVSALKTALHTQEPNYFLGITILSIVIIEIVGIRWKVLCLRRRSCDLNFTPEGSMFAIFIVASISHIIISSLLTLASLDSMKLLDTDSKYSIIAPVIFVAIIFKEFGLLLVSGGKSIAEGANYSYKEQISDLIFLAYSCVGYTALWSVLIDFSETPTNKIETIVATPFVALLFLFIYPAFRIPWLLEEYYLSPSNGRRRRLFLEMSFGLALGIYPLILSLISS